MDVLLGIWAVLVTGVAFVSFRPAEGLAIYVRGKALVDKLKRRVDGE